MGGWTIDPANSAPTGITIDPSNVNNIWIVDAGPRQIYQYNGAANTTSGSRKAFATYSLAAGNTNPQGIADPPVSSAISFSAVAVPTPSAAPIHLATGQPSSDTKREQLDRSSEFIPLGRGALATHLVPAPAPVQLPSDQSKSPSRAESPTVTSVKRLTQLTDNIFGNWESELKDDFVF